MIVVVGLSHKTAAIAVREKLALPAAEIPEWLTSLTGSPDVEEAMLISTCNRAEVVAAGDRSGTDVDAVAERVLGRLNEQAPGVRRHLYVHRGADAVRHLFRVASSLDSLVLGEPQILGQVKDAFETARKAGTVGPVLNGTVPRALRAAKKVRTDTAIGSGQVSVPSVAVDLAKQIFGSLRGRKVALVGSGEMGETVARLLTQSGAALTVVGRNQTRVAQLTRELGGIPRKLTELRETVGEADVVVTSTSAPLPIIQPELLRDVSRARRGRSLFLVDLAVPRDVDPRVESIDGVFLYNVDDFSKVVAESAQERRREADRAELIVAQEVEGYDRWAEVTQLTPAIVAIRSRFDAVIRGELDKSLRTRLQHLGDEERVALGKMADAILNKLLHSPTQRLRELVPESDDAVALLTDLFDVDPTSGPHEAVPVAPEEPDSADDAEDGAEARKTGTEPQ